MTNRTFSLLRALLPLCFCFSAHAHATDLFDRLSSDARFSRFVAAIRSAGLEDAFRGVEPKTVFAPTDDAFARLPAAISASLASDPALLLDTVLGHLAPRAMSIADLQEKARDPTPWSTGVLTAAGTHLSVHIENSPQGGRLLMNRAQIIAGDIVATNGLIQAVDGVLFAHLPMTSVAGLNLGSFMGKWFEIARLPTSFERGCSKSSLEILPLADGSYAAQDSCTHEDGKLEVTVGQLRDVDPENHSRWTLDFTHAWSGTVWAVEFGPDFAILATPNRRALWILSRTPTLDDARLRDGINRSIARGFAVGRLERVPQ